MFDQVDDEGEGEDENVETFIDRKRLGKDEETVQHDVEHVGLFASQLRTLG